MPHFEHSDTEIKAVTAPEVIAVSAAPIPTDIKFLTGLELDDSVQMAASQVRLELVDGGVSDTKIEPIDRPHLPKRQSTESNGGNTADDLVALLAKRDFTG